MEHKAPSITDSSTGKIAYLDCPTGIAGDMCLGAIVDAGMPLTVLVARLAQLGLDDEYQLVAQTVQRQSQVATQVQVHLTTDSDSGHSHPDVDHGAHHHHHSPLAASPTINSTHHSGHENSGHSRHLPEIETIIQEAKLSPRATAWSLAVFRQLAKAEAAVHGIPPEQVHFHEVGATDAIVDIVGTCIGLDWLGVEQVYCSALPVGGGTVRAAHGRLPVPAPAVLRLLTHAQAQIYSNGIQKELVTPTGAAIATTLSQCFGAAPSMTLNTVGYGAGGRDLPIANVLRLWLGQVDSYRNQPHAHSLPEPLPAEISQPSPTETVETVVELQTQVDDLTPQAIGYLYEPLFAAGALDVFTQSVGMKKNRPGILLTVICHVEQAQSCTEVLFKETTTLGVRQTTQHRQYLYRECRQISTPYGDIQIKIARTSPGGEVINLHPEYEDCADCAREQGVAWKQVYQSAISQAIQQLT